MPIGELLRGVKSFFRGRRLATFLILCLTLAIVLFLRGPYVSNMLKMAILSEVQEALGREVIAQKIILNVFPLYIEARGVKVFDENGEKVFRAKRIKAYLGLSGLLRREITVRRLSVSQPQLWAERSKLEEMAETFRTVGKRKGKGFRTVINMVVLKEGAFAIKDDASGVEYEAEGLDAEVDLRGKPDIRFSVAGFTARREGWPALKWDMAGRAASLDGGAFALKEFEARAGGSTLTAGGSYRGEGAGSFDLKLSLLARTVKDMLGLKNTGEGEVSASGRLQLAKAWRETSVDLDVGGNFHIETLMEALDVSPKHDIKGGIEFEGEVKGPLGDLEGRASAAIRKGSFFGVKLDKGKCNVRYADGKLSFTEGEAYLYGGRAKVNVTIGLPHVEPYSVRVDFSDVDSAAALGLVHLENLGLSRGRASGEFFSSGMHFEPEGRFMYKSEAPGETPIGRITEAQGGFKKIDEAVYISDLNARTGLTSLSLDGYLDGRTRELSFDGRITTDDVNDVLSPYFKRLKGRGEFSGSVRGTLEDPLVSGKIQISNTSIDGIALGRAGVEFSYRKDLMKVLSAIALVGDAKYEAKGTVEFPDAKKALDLANPRFRLDVSTRGAELRDILALAGKDLPVGGKLDSTFTVTGAPPDAVFSGKATAREASIYGRLVSSASASFVYDGKVFRLKDAALRKAEAFVSLTGQVGVDGGFVFDATSKDLHLSTVVGRALPFDYSMDIQARGRGTLEKPEIELSAALDEGRYKGVDIGGGTLRASLKGKAIEATASLLKDRATVRARATLAKGVSWSADVAVSQGRLDFLVVPYFKEVPDDLLLTLTGTAKLEGDREHARAEVSVSHLNLNMYRQGFTNDRDISVSVRDRDISFDEFTMKSGNALLKVSGGMTLGSAYNLDLEGRSSLALLSGLSGRIRDIRGEAVFVFSVQGDWDTPMINGGMTVADASFSLKDFPQRLTSVSGYFHVDRNRVVIENFDAELGGGRVSARGVVRLRGFKVGQAHFDTSIKDVTLSVSRRFIVNVGGNLIVRISDDTRDIAGDLHINKAEYGERVKWKSWLVAAGRQRARKSEARWADTVDLNIRLSGAEQILFNNNIARAHVRVDMLLRGTLGDPIFVGRLEASEGKVFFRNSELTITRATADFSESRPNDPFIALNASASVKGYEIQLNIEGHMDQFDLALSSNPPLEEVEVLGLLTIGEFGQGLSGLEGGVGAAEAASLVTGGFQDLVEEKLRGLTGLDRVQVDPYVSKYTGAITPRVTVSKRLGEKLSVKYSATMGSAEEQELKMEYTVTDTISLIGGRDDLGTLGGDVRFRFRFK